jgi:hypothetical protein
LYSSSGAGWNTALGYKAGSMMSGNSNVYIGAFAGSTLTGGSGNVFIGPQAGKFMPAWMPSITSDMFMLASGPNVLMAGSFTGQAMLFPSRVEIRETTWGPKLALVPNNPNFSSSISFSQALPDGSDTTFWFMSTGTSVSGGDFSIYRYPNSGIGGNLFMAQRSTGKLLINSWTGMGSTLPQASVEVRGNTLSGSPIFMASTSSGSMIFQVSGDTVTGAKIDIACQSGYSKVNSAGKMMGCIETSERTADSFMNALSFCSSMGARLPTFQEWYIAQNNPTSPSMTGAMNGNEWTSESDTTTYAFAYDGNLPTTLASILKTNTLNYRCYYGVR